MAKRLYIVFGVGRAGIQTPAIHLLNHDQFSFSKVSFPPLPLFQAFGNT